VTIVDADGNETRLPQDRTAEKVVIAMIAMIATAVVVLWLTRRPRSVI
jgi:hypothetical protein